MARFQIFVLLWNLCKLFSNCGCICTFLAGIWHQDVSITWTVVSGNLTLLNEAIRGCCFHEGWAWSAVLSRCTYMSDLRFSNTSHCGLRGAHSLHTHSAFFHIVGVLVLMFQPDSPPVMQLHMRPSATLCVFWQLSHRTRNALSRLSWSSLSTSSSQFCPRSAHLFIFSVSFDESDVHLLSLFTMKRLSVLFSCPVDAHNVKADLCRFAGALAQYRSLKIAFTRAIWGNHELTLVSQLVRTSDRMCKLTFDFLCIGFLISASYFLLDAADADDGR